MRKEHPLPFTKQELHKDCTGVRKLGKTSPQTPLDSRGKVINPHVYTLES